MRLEDPVGKDKFGWLAGYPKWNGSEEVSRLHQSDFFIIFNLTFSGHFERIP